MEESSGVNHLGPLPKREIQGLYIRANAMEKGKNSFVITPLYRDLPGGPKKITFMKEISHHYLCVVCKMLSMSMYKDSGGHRFCGSCLQTFSDDFGRNHIYCMSCCNDVDIDKMYQTLDPLNELREQYVDCPNRPCCRVKIPLEDLKAHYVTCKPEIKCSVCDQDIRSSDWDEHKYTCVKGSHATATSKRKGAKLSTTGILRKCPHCARNVKEINMNRHLASCPQVPVTCQHCKEDFPKVDRKWHQENCASLPPKIAEVAREHGCMDAWVGRRTDGQESIPFSGNLRTDAGMTGATGDNATRAYRAEDGSETLQPQGVKADAHGCYPLEKLIPELPTTDVEIEDMKTWRYILEQQFRVHGISDNWEKFEVLMSTLPPEVRRQVPKTAETLPPHQAYGYLLEVLFQISRSGGQRGIIDSITEATKARLEKFKLKVKQGTVIQRDAFLSVPGTLHGVPYHFMAYHSGIV